MMKKISSGLIILLIAILTSSLISGCAGLAEDVTPPPDLESSSPQPTIMPPTSQPEATQAPAVEAGDGSVVVEILDQTGGTLINTGLEVMLEGFDQFQLVYEAIEELPETGSAVFSDVPLEPERVFFASVAYGGAIYRSEIIQIEADTSALNLQIQIFDTTSETTGLIIDRLHILVDFISQDLLQVSEIFILSNLGAETIVAASPGQASVEFSLPSGAQNLVFEDGTLGQRFLQTDTGFGDTVGIPPGSGVYQVVVTYQLPYTRGRIDFSQTMDYPLSALVVLVPAGNVKVRNSSLTDMGIQSLPDGAIQVFSGGPLARAENLEFKMMGSPFASESGISWFGNLPGWLIFGLGGLGVGLLAGGIWLYLRSRGFDRDRSESLTQEEILDSIIALEDLFQTGEIDQKTYLTKRDQLKAQLRDNSGNE